MDSELRKPPAEYRSDLTAQVREHNENLSNLITRGIAGTRRCTFRPGLWHVSFNKLLEIKS